MTLIRQQIMHDAERIVVKVGTRVLTRTDGTLDDDQVACIADQLAALAQGGRQVVLVSSGAVAAGMGRLGMTRRPAHLAELQAAAAAGQSSVIESYNRALAAHGLHAAQILLTADDLHHRTRYLNVRNTLLALFRRHAIPIINENDTVSVDELQLSFGDNDRLAALVTNLLQAPLLILLSDIDGLYDGDPRQADAAIVPVVTDLAAARARWVHDRSTPSLSTGGMTSKLTAAQIAVAAGENVVIANGRRAGVITDIVAGKEVGTLILAEGRTIAARKRWIGWSASPRGQLCLDDGARRAIAEQGRSLLAVGVQEVRGDFEKGDVVSLCDLAGVEFARGLINYPASEMRTIAGQPTDKIATLLGHCPYDNVVHRDNLQVLRSTV